MKLQQLNAVLIGMVTLSIISACSSTKPKSNSMYNMVARMEVTEPIEGVCDNNNVIAILPLSGNNQIKAKAPKTDAEITTELNEQVTFLKENPSHEDKGMVNIIINCEGEMVQCYVGNKTKSPELDEQIEAVFSEMKMWKAGTLNKKPVDTVVLYSFTIENGRITIS